MIPLALAGEQALSSPPVAIVLEPDPQVRRLLRRLLPSEGFRLVEVLRPRGAAGRNAAPPGFPPGRSRLPEGDWRGADPASARVVSGSDPGAGGGRPDTHQAALEAGADEYVSKPFSIEEFQARVRLALRRRQRAHQPGLNAEAPVRVGDLHIELASRRITMRGRAVHLTPLEYRLLVALCDHVGQVVSRRQLLLDVWGPRFSGTFTDAGTPGPLSARVHGATAPQARS